MCYHITVYGVHMYYTYNEVLSGARYFPRGRFRTAVTTTQVYNVTPFPLHGVHCVSVASKMKKQLPLKLTFYNTPHTVYIKCAVCF